MASGGKVAFFHGLDALVSSLSTEELEGGLTVWEWAAKSGKNPKWVREKLNILNASGLLEIGKKKVRNLEGIEVMETAFKIIVPKG